MARVAARMEVLVLMHALASVAAWLRGQVACQDRDDQRLLAHPQAKKRSRRTLSVWRVGWEILRRGWPPSGQKASEPLPTSIEAVNLLALPG